MHRHLKPANVMIDGRGQVIIMDFGLAGLSDQLLGDARSGTPAYMSPEQLAGTEVTAKSDICALGLLLSSGIDRSAAAGTPVSLTSLMKEVDPAVECVILRCLAPDPKQRPPSALAVAAALPRRR